MENKLRIGVDLDGTLADYQNNLLQFLKKSGLTNSNEIKRDDCYDLLGPSIFSRAFRLRKFYTATKGLRGIKAVRGSKKAIKSLISEGHELHLVSSRFRGFAKGTKFWLAENYPADSFQTMRFSSLLSSLGSRFKAYKYAQCGADVVIEDAPDVALRCIKRGIPVILLDYPWNKELKHPMIKRADNWDEVVRQIQSFGRKNAGD